MNVPDDNQPSDARAALVPIAATALSIPAAAGLASPVLGYLARLGSSSRRTMLTALNTIARLLAGETARAATLPWHLLEPVHTSALRSALVDKYAPATANKTLAALRGVLREAWRLGQIDAELYHRLRDLPSAPGSRLLAGRQVERDELRALFAACGGSPRGRRDAAILALGFGGGLRRSEIVGIDCGDLDVARGAVTVTGKGRKQRQVFLAVGAADAIAGWMAIRGNEAGPLLHPVRKGDTIVRRRMAAQSVRDVLAALVEKARVGKMSPHDARRTWVSGLLDAGADLSCVQRLAGHSSVSTTQRYDRRPEHAARRAALLFSIPSAGAPGE
jgi:site-specific recombinase XerC